MKIKRFAAYNGGFTLLETGLATAILGMIVMGVFLMMYFSTRTGMNYKYKQKANRFAQAIIDDLRHRAIDQYTSINDGDIYSYNNFMEVDAQAGVFEMYAEIDIQSNDGEGDRKDIDIIVRWHDPSIPRAEAGVAKPLEAVYHTRVNLRGLLISGGIVVGQVLYLASLNTDPAQLNHIPVFSPATRDLYQGAAGMLVEAAAEGEPNKKVRTRTNEDGSFRLKNVMLGGTTVYFYKEGSKVDSYFSIQGYYFCEPGSGMSPSNDYPVNQNGVHSELVYPSTAGEVIDVGVITCARTWDMCLQVVYRYDPSPDPLTNFCNFVDNNSTGGLEDYNLFGSKRLYVEGDAVKWGTGNACHITHPTYWDISHLLQTSSSTVRGEGYNLMIKTLRGAYTTNAYKDLKITLKFNRVNGSASHIVPGDPLFYWGIVEHNSTPSYTYKAVPQIDVKLNPWLIEPFGDAVVEKFPHLAAPLVNGGLISEALHTQDFLNTLNLLAPSGSFSPTKVQLTRKGWITGEVWAEGPGPENDLTGLSIHYFTGGRYSSYSRGWQAYSNIVKHEVGPAKNYFRIYNIVDLARAYFDDVHCVPWSGTERFGSGNFCVYGVAGGKKYWGKIVEVNDHPYADTDNAYVVRGQGNTMKATVYPGARIKGHFITTTDRGDLPNWRVYARAAGVFNEAIQCVATRQGASPFHYDYDLSDVIRSVRGAETLMPIVAVSSPQYGVRARFMIRVLGDGSPVPGTPVQVRQLMLSTASNNTGEFWCTWIDPVSGLPGPDVMYTDANGVIDEEIIIPFKSKWNREIQRDAPGTQVFHFTDLPQNDAINNPFEAKFDDAVDDLHASFYYVVVNPPSPYGSSVAYYYSSVWCYEKPLGNEVWRVNHVSPYPVTLGDHDGFPDGTIISGTFNFSTPAPPTYILNLVVIIKDGTIMGSPPVDVQRIELITDDGLCIYTPGMINGGNRDLDTVRTGVGKYTFIGLSCTAIGKTVTFVNAYTDDGKQLKAIPELGVPPYVYSHAQDGTYIFEIEPPSGG